MPSSPSMPTVSAPALGNGFYVPGSEGFYTGSKNVPAGTSSKKQEISATEKTTSENSNFSSASLNSTLQNFDYNSLNSDYSSLSNLLTAGDISSLSNMGAFTSVSSLLKKNNMLATTDDSQILKQILSELNELKAEVKTNSNSNTSLTATTTTENSASSILRFSVNGQNILPSCNTVYFSKQESDGTFLLTGDRKYAFGKTVNYETFHFLFKANGTKDGCIIFKVTPTLTQTTENLNSSLYKLCQSQNLTAQKTGNLVTMRWSESGTKIDLLLALE